MIRFKKIVTSVGGEITSRERMGSGNETTEGNGMEQSRQHGNNYCIND